MNQPEAAEALGCSVATISRLRSGDRIPGVALMKEIRRVFSWGVDAQLEAVDRGAYAVEFAYRMDRRRVRRRMRRARISTTTLADDPDLSAIPLEPGTHSIEVTPGGHVVDA